MHAISKIIAQHAGRPEVEVGEIVNVAPDYVMLNDRGAARAADLLRKMGGDKVFDPDRRSWWCSTITTHRSGAGFGVAENTRGNGSRSRASRNFMQAKVSAT